MSASKGFKESISAHLQSVADADPLFAETLKKPNKNIDECCTYITNEVRKNHTGSAVAVSDAEVFGMAIHYYDEDDIKVSKQVEARVSSPSKSDKLPDNATREEVIAHGKNMPGPTQAKPAKKAKPGIDPSIQPSFF